MICIEGGTDTHVDGTTEKTVPFCMLLLCLVAMPDCLMVLLCIEGETNTEMEETTSEQIVHYFMSIVRPACSMWALKDIERRT